MVRELFTRLRKSKKQEVPAAEPHKRFRRWLIHGRTTEFDDAKLRRIVTTNKIEPWFNRVFSPHTEQATALYSFPAQTDQEVSFKKGDTLAVEFHQSEEWLEATNVETEMKGLIPASYITLERNILHVLDAWQDITRLEAEWKLLMSGLPHGTFILRPSSYKVNGHHRLLSHPLPKPPPPALQAREFSIDRSQVELGKRIHSGSFGRTYLATYRSCEVIAKRASSSKSRSHLLEVGKLLHQLSHPRLVRLLGVCGDNSDDQPILYIT
ncbi:unnamed protein product, partial [Schistocephalus solidus]|uniref:non-specific protein-tyrosine kinase n=1 Tax=Schistocephalus solidus TaxID=70667 RepID=A0A183SX07_SCHSO